MNHESNPYRPPGTELASDPAPTALYSPGQGSAAAFFGGPLAGAAIIALNYRDLGNPSAQRTAIVVGLGATAALFVLDAGLPEGLPPVVFPLIGALAVRFLMHRLQGQPYYSLREFGGKRHSNWRVAGITLACSAITLVLMFGAFLLVPEGFLPPE